MTKLMESERNVTELEKEKDAIKKIQQVMTSFYLFVCICVCVCVCVCDSLMTKI